jgi:hypothetical protein
MNRWIEGEVKTTNMRDKRLNNRLKQILMTLSKDPQKSIPNNCETWSSTQATYRFLNNHSVTSADILKGHIQATVKRVKDQKAEEQKKNKRQSEKIPLKITNII